MLTGGKYDFWLTQEYSDGTRLKGEWVIDKVCITSSSSSCTENFEWVAVVYATGLGSTIDGVLGLMSGGGGDRDPLFIWSAYKEGVLAEPTFSVYMTNGDSPTDRSGSSYIDFGEPNTGGARVTYVDVWNNDPWWSAEIYGIYFENDPD